jgi:prepilin-type N-terminal cleavage/methylation domain-containing protein
MKKRAFTMIELIVVIVTLAILAAYSIPRINRDTRSEAINHMLTMMRYTQNLALHDDMHLKENPKWQRRFWRFEIHKCSSNSGLYYSIVTDNDMQGSADKVETAIDPSNSKYTYWIETKKCPKNSTDALMADVSPNIFITQKYGINSVEFKSCQIYTNRKVSSSVKHIGFDNFGRYYKSFTSSQIPNNSGVGIGDCKIKFNFSNSSINPFTIVVSKESGFIYLQENPNL